MFLLGLKRIARISGAYICQRKALIKKKDFMKLTKKLMQTNAGKKNFFWLKC